MNLSDKKKLENWQEYVETIRAATPVDTSMSEAEKLRMRASLEKDPFRWMCYFFPMYAKYPFASFQKKAIRRILRHPEWFEVLSWARELAKSTVVMFCVLFLVLTGKKRFVIIASATLAAAERLLAPYRANLEGNARIRFFYGVQDGPGQQWTSDFFVTRNGSTFLAIGAGSAPRGARQEAVRPDVIIVDDFDTDEECRNPVSLNKKWEWWEKALYPTRAINEPTLIIFCGNIIARDTCVSRAGAKADNWDIVNIVDKDGNSSWPEKNRIEDIERIRTSISSKAYQGEYMNNPVAEGKVFRYLPWGKVPDLSKFKFLICYGDPAYSNRRDKSNSMKAVCLVGRIKQTYYIIKCFVARETNANYINWFYRIRDYVGDMTTVYYYQENNSLQDPFFEQVFKPLLQQQNQERGETLYIRPDVRAKIDKASRIEAALEPLDRTGAWIFNETEHDNPHMQELRDQLLLFEMSLPYAADGADCLEGAINILDTKLREYTGIVDTLSYDDMRNRRNKL